MRMTSATGSKRRRSRAGFTLIELGVTVFVIALMLALAAPQFVRSYNSSLLSETARNFATTCQFARIQAVSQQQPALVHIDPRQQRFWLTQLLTSADGATEEHTLRAEQVSPRIRLVKAEVTAATEASDPQVAVMTFYPNGTCDAATVYFRGEGKGSDLAVSLDPITGKPVVYPVKS